MYLSNQIGVSILKLIVTIGLIAVFFMWPLSVMAENRNIKILTLNYGFKEAIEFCQYKHHGSYTIVSEAYESWYLENRDEIEKAHQELEKEAAEDPIKEAKLPQLEPYARGMYRKSYMELSNEESALMCFDKETILELFDYIDEYITNQNSRMHDSGDENGY